MEIIITVVMNDIRYEVKTFEGEYENLMMLLFDRMMLDDFGECKGIGRCGTCHVYLLNPKEEWAIKEKNENNTLNKLFDRSEDSRLACQIVVDASINGMCVRLPG